MASGVETDKVPPVPQHTPPRAGDKINDNKSLIARPWADWFERVRVKINLINDSIANLAGVTGNGLLVQSGGNWVFRRLEGVAGQIVVEEPAGTAGDPIIGLAQDVLDILADAGTALQPGDNISELVNDSQYLQYEELKTTLLPGANVTLTPDDMAQTITITSTGGGGTGGGVDTITQGQGIAVDNTDPENPVVSLSAMALANMALAATSVQPDDLGTAAYEDADDFATAAQGALADTALQLDSILPGTNVTFDTDPVAGTITINSAGSSISLALPFWNSLGVYSPINLTTNYQLPFWLSDGTQANIDTVEV